jgi:hypothetical protein
LLRLLKSLLDPVDYNLRRLNLFAVVFKPRKPDVDKFVAKQLIGGERKQYLKFLNGQEKLAGGRLVPDFFEFLDFLLEELILVV